MWGVSHRLRCQRRGARVMMDKTTALSTLVPIRSISPNLGHSTSSIKRLVLLWRCNRCKVLCLTYKQNNFKFEEVEYSKPLTFNPKRSCCLVIESDCRLGAAKRMSSRVFWVNCVKLTNRKPRSAHPHRLRKVTVESRVVICGQLMMLRYCNCRSGNDLRSSEVIAVL